MKYKKDQLDKRYRRIAYLKLVLGYSNLQISGMIANCKKRTIQHAIKYVKETPISNEVVVLERIEQLHDKAYDLCQLRETYRERMKYLSTKDPVHNPEVYTEFNKASDKLNVLIMKIAKIENQIYSLQGLFDRPKEKQKFTSCPKVIHKLSEAMIVRKEGGKYDIVPI